MTTVTDRLDSVRTTSAKLPGAWRLGLARGGLEVRAFFRQREQAVFTFAFPIVFLFLFASIFSDDVEGAGITASQLYVPAMIAAGIMSTSFQSLGISIAIERDQKQLRRLRGTPMPPAAYFLGKVWLVLVTGLLETAALLLVGTVFYDIDLPTGVGTWLTFGWIFVLGLTGCALLGIAISSVPKSGQSATSVVVLPFLVLQFISGVYIAIDTIPDWMLNISALFPLKWMCQGLRGVFLPESAAVLEQAGSWEYGRIALVLGAWCIGGLVLCLMTFKWKSRRDG
ncbi:ABC transporter permease [Streptomyces lunaelactis]|uniref:ABC transporter permease n=1 Tax=Streptomyces lunaelactis TaxID=1535768 RepID=UPI001585B057|nr:ABC transporter permease [Streptomyces lunaelactis]NUK01814.1 ABC transporter permease [Streptomyces lunaelactis]NUK15223.1 ABC transporter permease [Streptomyces lunaelactis]NUK69828.1 ABC transporter permease [Streptomyces lunaelactis]NUK80659.1 ABC transporter permease [Streptomyces lunaelactis]NUL04475.1 ABC transporter permease [Streptomyces lunaelactis]